MPATKENLQEALRLHSEWLAYSVWENKDEETRGKEPPKGKRLEAYHHAIDFFVGANLRWANLKGADLRDAILSDANLSDANFSDADLSRADLSDADFSSANLYRAILRWANLRDVILRDADLRDADLRDADFSSANLRGANLRGANLRLAIGNGREIKSAQVDKYLFSWTNTTLATGCQQHPLKDWLEFSDEKKASFASDGLPYLNKWLPILDSMGVFDPVKEAPLPEGEDHA